METNAERLERIKVDMQDTLEVLKESKHDRTEDVGFAPEYVAEVMENQKWLIEENARLREALRYYSDRRLYHREYNQLEERYEDSVIDSDFGNRAVKALEDKPT